MILAIANQKGGVGKTTTTAALAVNLGKRKKRVLVVDVDPQANCTATLGATTLADANTMFHVFEGLADLEDTFVDVAPGVTVAPSHISLAYCERSLHQQIDRERILARKLRPVAGSFDVILLDAPPSLGVFSFNVFAACDAVLVPIQSEPLALDGVSLLLDSLKAVREYELNPRCDVGGVVLTMFDQRRNIDKRVQEATRTIFPDVVFETTIPRDVRLVEFTETANAALLEGESHGASAYRKLAEEVIARWQI